MGASWVPAAAGAVRAGAIMRQVSARSPARAMRVVTQVPLLTRASPAPGSRARTLAPTAPVWHRGACHRPVVAPGRLRAAVPGGAITLMLVFVLPARGGPPVAVQPKARSQGQTVPGKPLADQLGQRLNRRVICRRALAASVQHRCGRGRLELNAPRPLYAFLRHWHRPAWPSARTGDGARDKPSADGYYGTGRGSAGAQLADLIARLPGSPD